jgi:CheY-like chemotaxis protein
LERWAQFDGEIPLLLTDMVMPGGLTGRELGERLRTRNPRLKVIYSSGYSPGQETKELAALPAEIFLPKPYRAGELLAKVRECLDTVRPN